MVELHGPHQGVQCGFATYAALGAVVHTWCTVLVARRALCLVTCQGVLAGRQAHLRQKTLCGGLSTVALRAQT